MRRRPGDGACALTAGERSEQWLRPTGLRTHLAAASRDLPYILRVPRRTKAASRSVSREVSREVDLASVSAHLADLDQTAGRSGRATRRKEQGSHYTPPALVGWILDRATDGRAAPARAPRRRSEALDEGEVAGDVQPPVGHRCRTGSYSY
jgi:hypothetical protein